MLPMTLRIGTTQNFRACKRRDKDVEENGDALTRDFAFCCRWRLRRLRLVALITALVGPASIIAKHQEPRAG
jgi:hypothetical protein